MRGLRSSYSIASIVLIAHIAKGDQWMGWRNEKGLDLNIVTLIEHSSSPDIGVYGGRVTARGLGESVR